MLFFVLLNRMGTTNDLDIVAARLQIFTMCLPRISVSRANCIQVTEPRTGRARTSALRIRDTAHYTTVHLADLPAKMR
jgi:hypothetical protein